MGIAEKFKTTLDEARKVMNDYFAAFPGIKEYIEAVRSFVYEYGYIIDMVGRKRMFSYSGWRRPGRMAHFISRLIEETQEYIKIPKADFRSFISAEVRQAVNFPCNWGITW